MHFKDQQAIYLQIADHVCENILLKKWPAGEKIISIRDLAVTIEVNPNTVQRAYDFLQQKEIISNRRGIGYFVENDAEKKIKAYRKDFFFENELPAVFKNMFLLGVSLKEFGTKYKRFVERKYKITIHETE
jgi:DNA-binding transcriptional regulator YhcF (GntR family)